MWSLIILGALQGLTEFLPVSSSGHLIVLRTLFGMALPGATVEVALHAGTLASVLLYYRPWIAKWVRQLTRGERAAWRYFMRLTVASLPAGALGIGFGHVIEDYFTVSAAVIGWLLTAVLLWVMPSPKEDRQSTPSMGLLGYLLIGLAQGLALWPGLSRSGSTIAMGRAVGLDPEEAARFSFLMAVPAVLGALVFEIPSLRLSGIPWMDMTLAALVAAMAGLVAIQWVTRIVNHPHAWRGFAIYLVLAAVAVRIFGG